MIWALIVSLIAIGTAWADVHIFSKLVDVPRLNQEMKDNMGLSLMRSHVSDTVDGSIKVKGTEVTMNFDNTLTGEQASLLADIVSSHTATALPVTSLSVPNMSFNGFNSTLGHGTTFAKFVPSSDIELKAVAATIVVSAPGGNEHTFHCGTSENQIVVSVPGSATAGTVFNSTGSAFVLAGSTVGMWLQSDGNPTYCVNMECEYILQ